MRLGGRDGLAGFASIALAVPVMLWGSASSAGERAQLAVSATVVSRCEVSSAALSGAVTPRTALQATRVACDGRVPFGVAAAPAGEAPLPQAGWTADPDGTVLVTVTY